MHVKIHGSAMFVAGVVSALVISGGGAVAYAANGGTLILGKANTATKTTTLSSAGTPLRLASGRAAPLAVNNTRKVVNLNADRLDGLSAESFLPTSAAAGFLPTSAAAGFLPTSAAAGFMSAAASTGYVRNSGIVTDIDGNGVIDSIIATVRCPAGSMLTGGGNDDLTATGFGVLNSPSSDGKGWIVADVVSPTGGDVGTDLVAYAVCLNPKGAVGTGGLAFSRSSAGHVSLTAAQRAKIAMKAASL
jgi:hypothetical protein